MRPRSVRATQPRNPAPSIEPSAPIASLFSRAEEGIKRGDWKFAIDCLQRIIDDPDGSLVFKAAEANEERFLYESARLRALRRLASLPPEGLRAYRLLYDGKAKCLYDLARGAHDPRLLRTVVNRYLLTDCGDDATDLLASWALDAGRFTEALTVLTELRDLAGDGDVPDALITAKITAAYALLGRLAEAESVMNGFAVGKGENATAWDEEVVHPRKLNMPDTLLALRPPPPGPEGDLTLWSIVGGSTARRGWMPAVEPTLSEDVPWAFDLPGGTADAWRRVFFDDPTGPAAIPVVQAVTDGHRLFAPTRRGCVALAVEDLSLVSSRSGLSQLQGRGLGRPAAG